MALHVLHVLPVAGWVRRFSVSVHLALTVWGVVMVLLMVFVDHLAEE
jgi:hypothetical protein